MAKRKYPVKRFTLTVKMQCDYHPNGYRRCTNVAKVIKFGKSGEGKQVYTYCEKCFKNYLFREREWRRTHAN